MMLDLGTERTHHDVTPKVQWDTYFTCIHLARKKSVIVKAQIHWNRENSQYLVTGSSKVEPCWVFLQIGLLSIKTLNRERQRDRQDSG